LAPSRDISIKSPESFRSFSLVMTLANTAQQG
jgi:hypothetical protein